jgi:hypothetical protein
MYRHGEICVRSLLANGNHLIGSQFCRFYISFSLHVLCQNSVDLAVPVIKQIIGRELRLRLNLQGGSLLEVQQALQEYGLTTEHVDAIFHGVSYHECQAKVWLAERYGEEEKAETDKSLQPGAH